MVGKEVFIPFHAHHQIGDFFGCRRYDFLAAVQIGFGVYADFAINLREGDAIASVMAVPAAGDEEEVQTAEGAENGAETPATDAPSAEE